MQSYQVMRVKADMRVIIAAGGTAGHINPGLAIADKIKEVFPDSSILFVGTPQGMEARLVKKAGYDFTSFKIAGLQRNFSFNSIKRNIKAGYYYLTASKAAKKIIKGFNPDIVIGTGGYVSMPILQAAVKMKIKTANHESNSYPGISTKILSKSVDKIFVASKEAIKYLAHPENCVVTGNPMRNNIPIEDKSKARERLGLSDDFTILSSGGSSGSNKITEAVVALLKWELEQGNINHIHSYGKNGKGFFFEQLKKQGVKPDSKRTIIKEYIDNMYTCYSAADLVISRAGSMSQTELKVIGRASVQIPWAGATENHQYHNAAEMEKNGAAVMIVDEELCAEKLISEIKKLYVNQKKLRTMEIKAGEMAVKDSADRILGEILDLIKSNN